MQDKSKDIKIKELEEKLVEYENNWKRALADYRNLQKRTEEEKESLVSFINSVLLKRFLGVLDNLELLEKHLADQGVQLITKEFKQILTEEGLRELEVMNKDFDPETMEAIESVEGEPNKVVEILNKGYMLKDKLLRPARVKVGNKEESAQA